MLELGDCSSSNEESCHCNICKSGIEEYKRRVEESFKNYGFFIHMIIKDPNHPFGINFHTHGLPESFNHKNLQICFPIDESTAYDIIHNIVNNIREKRSIYYPGKIVSNIIDPFDITFISVKENDEDILRVIFPDEKGCLIKEQINPIYLSQWD